MHYAVKDVLTKIDRMVPFDLQEEWDNSGLILGDPHCKVESVVIALDLTLEVIEKAHELKANLVITHHPPILSPIKCWDTSNYAESLFYKAAHDNLNLIAVHTNLDVSYNGINVALAEAIEITDFKPLSEGPEGAFGLGAWGYMKREVSREELAKILNAAWQIPWIAFYGEKKRFKTIALCGGSGGNLWINAANFNVDLYITADMKYHQIAEAQQRLNIALVDHGQMERSGLSKFIKDLQQSLEIQVHDLTDIKVYSPPRIISFD
ncbi:Nif3-like dinuclear metal center hexameric protein [Acetomicrobium sp.]|jgi:dinuclear metal center YbgI/SA1388 family protein|uniref:Nif3-like dinuclear metal center hexameric protein n=1 Tax=Acetomicrobium sp. TaxID=1872099 RepID=UPI002FC73255